MSHTYREQFYVVETRYVGPNQNQDEYANADTIEIRTAPAVTNQSGDVCLDGWCGTTNDWAVYAHGEHATIEEARSAIVEKFGPVRDSDPNGECFESDEEIVVEVYKTGRYERMGWAATEEFAADGIAADIQADTLDERITELVAEYEADANIDGYTLASELEEMLLAARQELRDELAH
jgi:hypothetical protein